MYSSTGKAQGIHSQVLACSLDLVPTVLDWSDVKYPSYKLNGMEVRYLDSFSSVNTLYVVW